MKNFLSKVIGIVLLFTMSISAHAQSITVKGNVKDAKGEPIELAADNDFLKRTDLNKRLAHRCLLMAGISDFALRNIPTAVSRWFTNRDKLVPANPTFYSFTMNPDGSVGRSEYNEDAFGNECFTN